MLYLKGGAAATSNRFDLLDAVTGLGLTSDETTRWGGTVGVGFEYGFAPNWSVPRLTMMCMRAENFGG